MLKLIIKWIAFALVVMFVAWLIPGITVSDFPSAMIAAVVIVFVRYAAANANCVAKIQIFTISA